MCTGEVTITNRSMPRSASIRLRITASSWVFARFRFDDHAIGWHAQRDDRAADRFGFRQRFASLSVTPPETDHQRIAQEPIHARRFQRAQRRRRCHDRQATAGPANRPAAAAEQHDRLRAGRAIRGRERPVVAVSVRASSPRRPDS